MLTTHRYSNHIYNRAAQWFVLWVIVIVASLTLSDWPLHPGTWADDDPTQQIRLNQPKDVLSVDGDLYITDVDAQGNGRLLVCTAGGLTRVLPGLKQPHGLAFDNIRRILYVADTGNGRILCRQSNSSNFSICATGRRTPTGLTVDNTTGNLYFADTGENRIWCLTPQRVPCQVPIEAQLNNPEGVAVWLGTLYIADTGNNRIVSRSIVNPCNQARTTIERIAPPGIPALNQPSDLTVWLNMLYITDKCNNRILQMDLTNNTTQVAGVGSPGCGAGGYNGDGPATSVLLNGPEGIDAYLGTLFIADAANDRIRQVDGGFLSTVNCQ